MANTTQSEPVGFDDPHRERKLTFWIVGGVVLLLFIIGLIARRHNDKTEAAQTKAAQVQVAFTRAGLMAPSSDQIINTLGEDGDVVCQDPEAALGRAIHYGVSTSGAGGPGTRTVYTPRQLVTGTGLVLAVYCPDKLPEFLRNVENLKIADTIPGSIEMTSLADRVSALMPQVKTELAELVAMTSVADERQYPPEECAKAAKWVLDKFAGVGFESLRLETTADGSKAVYGERPGPSGAPTVLLYAHYDVQPPVDEKAWRTPPFTMTEVDGRWYGRGTADCKGNILMHLTALRALEGDVPVSLKLIVEGSEEQGTGGLEDFVPRNADLLRADAILVCDTGNAAVGVPAVTISLRGLANVVVTVEALSSEMHSGMFGGAAPDALAALIHILATLRDAHGNTTVTGLDSTQTWEGVAYDPQTFRKDANVLDGVDLLGDGTVSDMLWARPTATVLGIDCPPVVGSAAAIQPRAKARINLRVPPGMDPIKAQDALIAHLEAAAPWNVKVTVEREASGSPFRAKTGGPAYQALDQAMADSYGKGFTTLGQGGSIPLCNVFAGTYPDAEIILMGVEEPLTLMHAPNESVAPSEIEHMALAEARFLQHYAKVGAR